MVPDNEFSLPFSKDAVFKLDLPVHTRVELAGQEILYNKPNSVFSYEEIVALFKGVLAPSPAIPFFYLHNNRSKKSVANLGQGISLMVLEPGMKWRKALIKVSFDVEFEEVEQDEADQELNTIFDGNT